jgi:CheY-like chemotaxis protein
LLVEMMGGAIGVESALGAGSVFWFELASAAAPELVAEGAVPTAEPRARDPQDATPRTLLYVEDNIANLKLVEQLVGRRRDVRLLSAGNATLGIEIARASLPDMILMDINLPGINGYQALEILQKDPATAHIPVLAISANAMMGDIKKGLEAGFFRYLTKPIHVNEFMEAMDAVLEVARKNISTWPGGSPEVRR